MSEFYPHPRMKDGHLGKCKGCTKADVEARRQLKMATDPEWAEREAERHRMKARKTWADGKRPDRESRLLADRDYRKRYPEKTKARMAVQRLKRKDGTHLHHWSYLEEHWTDVIEIGSKDHATAHRFMVYDQERMQYRRTDTMELLDTREAHENYIQEVTPK